MVAIDTYRRGQPTWVDLVTTDPEQARAFYRALFGWDHEIGSAETGHYTMCRLDGRIVAGMNGDPSENVPPSWTSYFASEDVEADAPTVTDHGGSIMIGPLQIPERGGLLVATDPTGAVFGLWQAGGHRGAEVRDEPGALVWSELATRDLSGAVDFYSALFDYEWEDVDTGDGGPAYRTFAVDGEVAGGVMAMDDGWPADIPPHWMPYFGVGDADAAAATAERLGAGVSVPPTTTPFGRFTVIADPQGARFTAMDSATRSESAADA